MEVVIQIEKLFHGTVFAFDKLNVINNQQIVLFVLLLKHIIAVGTHRAHKAADIVVRVHIAHLGFGVVFQQLIADGLNQMGFTQAGAAV